jgi:integrase
MVRAGISVPALQHLMGHSQIHTTMLYVQLAPQACRPPVFLPIRRRRRFRRVGS